MKHDWDMGTYLLRPQERLAFRSRKKTRDTCFEMYFSPCIYVRNSRRKKYEMSKQNNINKWILNQFSVFDEVRWELLSHVRVSSGTQLNFALADALHLIKSCLRFRVLKARELPLFLDDWVEFKADALRCFEHWKIEDVLDLTNLKCCLIKSRKAPLAKLIKMLTLDVTFNRTFREIIPKTLDDFHRSHLTRWCDLNIKTI